MVELKPESADGRHRRSVQSRQRIVAAMLELVEAGAITPRAEDVAVRAGIGLRSVFRHFRDMESLYAEMTVEIARVYAAASIPFVATDWRGQLAEAVDRRSQTYERLMPFKRAADAHRHESPTIQLGHEATTAVLRARLETVLAEPFRDDPLALEAVDLLLSFETWHRLRIEQRLEANVARALIDRQLALLLPA